MESLARGPLHFALDYPYKLTYWSARNSEAFVDVCFTSEIERKHLQRCLSQEFLQLQHKRLIPEGFREQILQIELNEHSSCKVCDNGRRLCSNAVVHISLGQQDLFASNLVAWLMMSISAQSLFSHVFGSVAQVNGREIAPCEHIKP